MSETPTPSRQQQDAIKRKQLFEEADTKGRIQKASGTLLGVHDALPADEKLLVINVDAKDGVPALIMVTRDPDIIAQMKAIEAATRPPEATTSGG